MALSRTLSQLSDTTSKLSQLHADQADVDFYVISELIKDYVCVIQSIKVCSTFHISLGSFQRNLLKAYVKFTKHNYSLCNRLVTLAIGMLTQSTANDAVFGNFRPLFSMSCTPLMLTAHSSFGSCVTYQLGKSHIMIIMMIIIIIKCFYDTPVCRRGVGGQVDG